MTGTRGVWEVFISIEEAHLLGLAWNLEFNLSGLCVNLQRGRYICP